MKVILRNKYPFLGETQIENMGLAVFNGDKLVGELSGIDSISHLIVTRKLNNAIISIPNPFDKESSIAIQISLAKPTDNSVRLVNNFPYIMSTSYISACILSLSNGIDYNNEENLAKLQEYINYYLETSISNYLYKTSKEFKSDIAGFGKSLRKKCLTLNDFENLDWLNNYENTFFSVNVNSKIVNSNLFSKIS